MKLTLLLVAALLAGWNWLSVWRGWRRAEWVSKPGALILLFAWYAAEGGFSSGALAWFGSGILLSLAGDVFLLLPNREKWFVWGLGAFLLAHAAYIIGFNNPPAPLTALTLGLAALVGFTVLPYIRRLLLSLRQNGQSRLLDAVRLYAGALTLMLYSALVTLFRSDWANTPAYLVSAGALLFVFSDMLLGWNAFVKPLGRGSVAIMILYHLGQGLLAAGALAQYAGFTF
jgi:uncharacterized membrane protein YhhN